MEEPVKLEVSTFLFGPYKLPGPAETLLTHDFLRLRVNLGAESLQIHLSSAEVAAFVILHDRNVGGALEVHLYLWAASKLRAALGPKYDAFMEKRSAFSLIEQSEFFILLDFFNSDADNMNLLRTKLADCKRYHDIYWQLRLSSAPADDPRSNQAIEVMTESQWRVMLTVMGRSTLFADVSLATALRPPCEAIETQQETHEQSTSVQNNNETAEANAQEDVARFGAHAVVARVPNLRRRKGEPLTNWKQAFKQVRQKPLEEAREQIIQQSAGDLVVLSRKRISLTCPISGRRIETAARGVGCTHLECFDLAAYLQQQSRTPYWACPFAFCDQAVHLKDLIIDDYFNHALQTTDADIKEIELHPDGSFEPFQLGPAVPNRVEADVEIGDDDLEFHDNSLPPAHDLDRMLTIGAKVCEQLQSTLQDLGKELQTFNFMYLNGVKESFGELHEFARTHFSMNGNERPAAAVPLGVAKELHNRSTKVFRQLNDLGSKKALNDVAHALVALNSLIKQHIVGASKAGP